MAVRKAIVSGANGFVGSALVRELLDRDYQVLALVKKGNSGNLPDSRRLTLAEFELADAGRLAESIPAGDYAAFYHFAWAGPAGEARKDASLQLKNAEWTVDALRAAKKLGCRRFVCAGSIMEYEAAEEAFRQGKRPGPGSIYGGAKLAAHVMCMAVAAGIGMDLVWPLVTNAYGPGEISPRMVNTALRKCMKGEAPRFTEAAQNYDFVYIDDVARAFRMIAENGKPFHTYLVGSSAARPLKEFLLEMQASAAPGLDFIFGDVPFTGVSLPLERFSCRETEEDTGFHAEVSFAEGTRRTMEWLRAWDVRGRDGKDDGMVKGTGWKGEYHDPEI